MLEPALNRKRLIERSLLEIRAGRLEAAEKLCGELLAAEPDDPAAHQLAATVALQRDRLDDAERWIGSCLGLRPRHVPALILGGRIARAAGNWPQAIARFEHASLLSPNQPLPAFLLCACQLQQRAPDAQPLMARLLQQFPADADGWCEIGDTLQAIGLIEAAVTAYARAAGNSSEPKHRLRLGACLKSLGRWDEAVSAFRSGLTAASDQFEVRLMIGSCLRQGGDPGNACAEFERAVEIHANDSRGWFALGLARDDLQDREGAIVAYRRAVELRPVLPEAHVNLGLDLQHAGDLAAALNSYRRAFALRPDTFGRIAQALTSAKTGQLWLNTESLKKSLGG